MMTQAARSLEKVRPDLPVYHSRQQRREFSRLVGKIASSVTPAAIRAIYTELTNDATGPQNPEIDARIKQAMLGDDPDLVIDLRHLNKGTRIFSWVYY